ncbi:MAG: outer membrane protein, partial [Hyphomicrobiaceae bacterium]
ETDYEFDWMATVRGRIGYSIDRWLVYGTAGLAFLKEEQTRTQFRSNPGSASSPYGTATQEFFQEKDTALRQGWTVGGGFEYALTNRWSLKGEYLYSGFGKENFLFPEAREGVGAGYCPTVAFLCTSLPNLFPFVPGNSDNSNGRRASNDLDLHTVKLGINYRF